MDHIQTRESHTWIADSASKKFIEQNEAGETLRELSFESVKSDINSAMDSIGVKKDLVNPSTHFDETSSWFLNNAK